MNHSSTSLLHSVFRFILSKRWWIVSLYALLLGPSIYYAIKVTQDNSIDQLIVQSDPDFIANQQFSKVFGQGEYAVILVDAKDRFSPSVLKRFDQLEQKLAAIPQVNANSALSIFRRARAGFTADEHTARDFRQFISGTDLFRKQGLIGQKYLAIPLILQVHSSQERQQTLSAIERVLLEFEKQPTPFIGIRRVGQPYINAYLDNDTRAVGLRHFPIFALLVVALIVFLYRSLRTLLAFFITLGFSAALTVGYVGISGGSFTIVSALVPMTILITCTATLVYLHSRFVEQPKGHSLEEHHVEALANKFLACTASLFAAAVGFAALTVSSIRPIRELGITVAVGMIFIWLLVFTLFPALQRILKTPTQQQRKVAGHWFLHFTGWLPLFTYRYRWILVSSSLILCGLGGIALFGLPGLITPMHLQTNAIDYINPASELYRHTKQFETESAGLAITELWLKGSMGSISQPSVIRGLNHFQETLEKKAGIGAVVGLPTLLRMFRYLGGKGDVLPESEEELEALTDNLETLLPREPMLQSFVEKTNMAQTHILVITPTMDYEGFKRLEQLIQKHWQAASSRNPALKSFTMKTVGLAPLTAKISYYLVPTLVESFGLTVAIILGTFILIFRNGAARIMAMIPSLFAILVMFGFMRVTGMSLNVATIIIASTVLGATENDQIHFFYHFLEKRKNGSTEESLRHTFIISGRAIFFATLINAGGFLAFSLANLPPIRQFGILSSLAFLLSMIADFFALPAALWIIFREKPDELNVTQLLGKTSG